MKRDINTPIEKMKFFQPVQNEGCQPVVAYEDGTYKKLGQKRFYDQNEQYIVKTKKNDVYLVEKQKKPKKGRKKRQFQDGEEIKKPLNDKESAKRWVEFQRENKSRVDHHEDEVIEAPWKRIYRTEEVPKSYYMKTKFDKDLNQDFIPHNVPRTPYHLFRLFFDDNIYKLIVKETNIHKHQLYLKEIEKLPADQTPRKEPADYDTIDLDGYLSILICMGVHQMRSPRDYWKKDSFIHSEIACMMKKNKFMEFDKYLHLANNEDPVIANDIIGKVRVYLDIINKNFKKYYYPGEYLSIDEGMIPFTGRVSFKVYNPDKPNKFGIKEFVCCDAKNAYTLESQLYHGNHEEEQFTEVSLSKTNEVVMNLLKDYEGQFHKVVMDNYYNSPSLFYLMKQKAFGGLGTMRIGRLKLPPHLLAQIMEVHQNKLLSYIQGDVNLAIFFRGTNDKEICLMSNFLDHKLVKHDYWKILVNVKEDRDIFKEQSQMSAYYNKFKGGVDRRNAFLAIYRNKRRNFKWWRPVFYRMLDNAIVNAFILYNFNKSPNQKISQKDFRIQLFKALGNRYSPPKSEIAIRSLNLMRDISEEVNQQPQYFERIMKHHTMKRCNYAAHQLVKSRSKQKFCAECKVLTHFSCQTCSQMFKRRIAICATGFNQCYDTHASKSYEEVVERLFQKKRADGRVIKNIQKKVRKLVRTSDIHEIILGPCPQINENDQTQDLRYKKDRSCDIALFRKEIKPPNIQQDTTQVSNQNKVPLLQSQQVLTRSCSVDNVIQKKKFYLEDYFNVKNTNQGVTSYSQFKKKFRITKSGTNTTTSNMLGSTTMISTDNAQSSDIRTDFHFNASLNIHSSNIHHSDDEIIWVNDNNTIAEQNQTRSYQSKQEVKVQQFDDAIEIISSDSYLDDDVVKNDYIQFTFGGFPIKKKQESEDDETKEEKRISRLLQEVQVIKQTKIDDQLNNSGYFAEEVGVVFYPLDNKDEETEKSFEDIEENSYIQDNQNTNEHIKFQVKTEHKEIPVQHKNTQQLDDCEDLLNNGIDESNYSFLSMEDDVFEYKKQSKVNKIPETLDYEFEHKRIPYRQRNKKYMIDDDDVEDEDQKDDFGFEDSHVDFEVISDSDGSKVIEPQPYKQLKNEEQKFQQQPRRKIVPPKKQTQPLIAPTVLSEPLKLTFVRKQLQITQYFTKQASPPSNHKFNKIKQPKESIIKNDNQEECKSIQKKKELIIDNKRCIIVKKQKPLDILEE